MRDGYILEHDRHHLVAGEFAAAPDGIRDFCRLAKGIPDASPAVTDHHEGAEIETPTALDDFGGPIDEYDLFGQFLGAAFLKSVLGRVARRTTPATTATSSAITTASATLSRFNKFCHSIFGLQVKISIRFRGRNPPAP